MMNTMITEVRTDGSTFMYDWSQFQMGFALDYAREASLLEHVAAMIVAQGQDGTVCYAGGENVSLDYVVRLQNSLI